jgi:heptosyltransferase-2
MRRLLVRLPNWLGDALLARPLLHALRGAWPAGEVVLVGPPALLELLTPDGVASHTLPWSREPAVRQATRRAQRAIGADAFVVLPPSFSSAWAAWRSGSRVRVGFAGEGRSWLLTHALRRPPRGDLHLSEEYLALGSLIGAGPVPVPALRANRDGEERAEALLARHRLGGRPLALLGPGAIYGPAKRWEAARFAALARRLAAAGLAVLVCGTRDDRPAAEEVAAGAGADVVAIAGDTDLATQTALCARATLAVCNDSGLAHLCAACGAPTVTIFGSTSPAWTAPLGGRTAVVQRSPVCSPCFRRTCAIGYRCLTGVSVGDVAKACAEVAA